MKIVRIDWPRLDLYPMRGLVRTIDQMSVLLQDRRIRFPPSIYSDGASVPNALFPMLECSAVKLLGPGILHDACYRIDARWSDGTEITRPEADDLLRAVALESGVCELDAAKIRWATGVSGSKHWQKLRLGWVP